MQSRKQLRREAKQLFRLCLVEGLLDDGRVRRVVEKVLEAKRRGGFTLLSYFQRLVRLERSRRTAEVASATALPAKLQASGTPPPVVAKREVGSPPNAQGFTLGLSVCPPKVFR